MSSRERVGFLECVTKFVPEFGRYNCSKDLLWAVNNTHFHDIEFVVSNGEKTLRFAAHKVILCARSPYFKAMFTGGMKVLR